MGFLSGLDDGSVAWGLRFNAMISRLLFRLEIGVTVAVCLFAAGIAVSLVSAVFSALFAGSMFLMTFGMHSFGYFFWKPFVLGCILHLMLNVGAALSVLRSHRANRYPNGHRSAVYDAVSILVYLFQFHRLDII